MKKNNFNILITLLLLLFSFNLYSQENDKTNDKKEKLDERRFQFGIGTSITTSTIYDMYKNADIFKAIKNGDDYSYSYIDKDEDDHILSLNGDMQKAVLANHILKSLVYGIQFRFLWKVFMTEIDINVLPANYNYGNRTEISLTPMTGLRIPFVVMPYFLIGPTFTAGFYYDNYLKDRDDSNEIQAIKDNIRFLVGLSAKIGLDLKFDYFSIGIFYQYTIKNVGEIVDLYNTFNNDDLSREEIFKNILGSQSRFGLSMSIYFGNNKKHKTIKDQIKEEIKDEVKEELLDEIRDKVKEEIKELDEE